MAFKREIQGVVVKIAGEKTASVLVERKVVHPRYRKIVKRFKKYLIHDERNEVKVGDTVLFGKYSGTELHIDDKKYLVMNQNDILVIM